jgi:hypothetical protein
MVSNECKEKTKLYKDNEGRFIHVTYETDNQIFNIISVYALSLDNTVLFSTHNPGPFSTTQQLKFINAYI